MSGFTADEVERSQRYHRPRYAALVGGLALSVVTLALLTRLPLPGPWWLAPVLLEPVFNRFEPLADEALAARLLALADRAGAPGRAILVADASRRTTKANAYVSGIGRTRRVVLWDTLLASPHDQVAVVLAHELGHRVRRHVPVLTAVLMAGAAGFVLALPPVLPPPRPADT